MKETRKEIALNRLKMFGEGALGTLEMLIGIIIVVLEAAAKGSVHAMTMRILEDKGIFDYEIESVDICENAVDHFRNIGDLWSENRELKETLKEEKTISKEEARITKQEQAKKKAIAAILKKLNNMDIIAYVTKLMNKVKNFSVEEQRALISKIKEVLSDFNTKYISGIDKINSAQTEVDTDYLALAKETTMKKLYVIEQVMDNALKNKSNYKLKEKRVEKLITSTEEEIFPVQHTLKA